MNWFGFEVWLAAQVISCTGFRTGRYLEAILMAWGYSACRMMPRIAQRYHPGAEQAKRPLL